MQTASNSGPKIPARSGTNDTKIVLRLERVEKSLHQRTADTYHALCGTNLEVSVGGFIIIVGGSGVEESTSLDVIAGFILADFGWVKIDEASVTRLLEGNRTAMIGQVFRDPKQGTTPRMTMAEDLLLTPKHGESHSFKIATDESKYQEFRQLLAPLELGLEDCLDTETGMLSGGQRQSVVLIMTTLENPRLPLLDERTAALDPKTAYRILDYTANVMAEHRLATIMITHRLKGVLNFNNRMLVMDHGEIAHSLDAAAKSQMTDA